MAHVRWFAHYDLAAEIRCNAILMEACAGDVHTLVQYVKVVWGRGVAGEEGGRCLGRPRAQPGRAEASLAEPSQALPSLAEPSQALPSPAKPRFGAWWGMVGHGRAWRGTVGARRGMARHGRGRPRHGMGRGGAKQGPPSHAQPRIPPALFRQSDRGRARDVRGRHSSWLGAHARFGPFAPRLEAGKHVVFGPVHMWAVPPTQCRRARCRRRPGDPGRSGCLPEAGAPARSYICPRVRTLGRKRLVGLRPYVLPMRTLELGAFQWTKPVAPARTAGTQPTPGRPASGPLPATT